MTRMKPLPKQAILVVNTLLLILMVLATVGHAIFPVLTIESSSIATRVAGNTLSSVLTAICGILFVTFASLAYRHFTTGDGSKA